MTHRDVYTQDSVIQDVTRELARVEGLINRQAAEEHLRNEDRLHQSAPLEPKSLRLRSLEALVASLPAA